MDTDWCIMCDSHCNISGAIYCSRECELQDRLGAYPSLNSTSSTVQYPLSGNNKFERTSSVKFVTPKTPSIQFAKVQQQPLQQQSTLFYHRAPMPRYKHTSSKACSASNVRDRKMSKSLYVQ